MSAVEISGICQAWLRAREAWTRTRSDHALSQFMEADQRLLVMFATDWHDNLDRLPLAYHIFRKALVENQTSKPKPPSRLVYLV